MSIQEITLQVPCSYELPDLFSSIDAEATAHILSLGCTAYSLMKDEGQKINHETIYSQLLDSAHKEYQPKLINLQKEIETVQTMMESLKKQLYESEELRLGTEKRIREEEKRNRDDILKEKDTRIQALELQLRSSFSSVESTLKDNSKALVEQFQQFRDQLLKTTTGSKRKGEHGETIFAHHLQLAFGSVGRKEFFEIDNIGTEGHQGDIRMTWSGHRIMAEVKNYDRNVDQKEVNKFLRDMEESQDISLGLMVSLHTGITGHTKTGGVDLQELSDGRFCIYISHYMTLDDPVLFLQGLKPFMEVFLEARTKQSQLEDKGQTEEAQHLRDQMEKQRSVLNRLLQNHQNGLSKLKNTITNAQKKQAQIWLDISTEMRETEHQVKLLLETLLDFSSEIVATEQKVEIKENSSSKEELPTYIFRHGDLSNYLEKDKKFIRDIFKNFDVNDTISMPSKEFKELCKELGYSEDALTGIRSRVFLDTVWEKGKKDVKFLRKKLV